MICPHCGLETKDQAPFCQHCGTAIKQKVPVPSPAESPVVAPAQMQQHKAEFFQNAGVESKISNKWLWLMATIPLPVTVINSYILEFLLPGHGLFLGVLIGGGLYYLFEIMNIRYLNRNGCPICFYVSVWKRIYWYPISRAKNTTRKYAPVIVLNVIGVICFFMLMPLT